jgi:hypothetical protein
MEGITRRLFLRNSALVTAGTAIATPALAEAVPPETRIENAIAEIQAALKEMHPDWSVQDAQNDVQHVTRILNGRSEAGEAHSHAILLYAYDGAVGRQQAYWARHYR